MTPELLIIAGPNGAGKTTFVNTYLPEYTTIREFVNADLIARGISPFDPASAGIEAGRIEINRIRQLIELRQSFAVETTLSGKVYQQWIAAAKKAGYTIKLFFIYLNSPELSIERIADRVKKGGHDIAEEIVRRRHDRSLRNLFHTLPFVDEAQLFDNSGNDAYEFARKVNGEWNSSDSMLLERLQKAYANE